MFYNGNMKNERAAVVLRLSPSWFRFGSFEILARKGEKAELRQLMDFVIKESFPHILEMNKDSFEVLARTNPAI